MGGKDLALFRKICADFEDIQQEDLHTAFSTVLKLQYLKETNGPHHQKHVCGIVWGASLRPIISFPVQITDSILTLSGTRSAVHVHFLYLAASPQTFLADEAMMAMGIEDMVVVGEGYDQSSNEFLRLPLKINGYTLLVARSPPDAHFAHLNILGQDFVQLSGAQVHFGGTIPRFEIAFP